MPRDDYDDDFGDDLYDEQDEFSEEEGFSEIDFEEESSEEEELADDLLSEGDAELAGGEIEAPLLADGDDDQLAWRETYYILFQKHDRPTLTQVEAVVGDSGRRLTMEHLEADEDGLFLSVLVQAPEDNAALEISYEEGDAVMEQSAELAKHLQKRIDSEVLAQLLRADARLDVMHFERMHEAALLTEEAEDEMALEALNPATLISVVEALADLTGGVPIDPSAGEVMI